MGICPSVRRAGGGVESLSQASQPAFLRIKIAPYVGRLRKKQGDKTMERRSFMASVGALGVAAALPGRVLASNAPVALGYTATTDFTSTFVGVEEGFFKK